MLQSNNPKTEKREAVFEVYSFFKGMVAKRFKNFADAVAMQSELKRKGLWDAFVYDYQHDKIVVR